MKKHNLAKAALVIFGVVSVNFIFTTASEAGKRKPRYCEIKELTKKVPGIPLFVALPDGPLDANHELRRYYTCTVRPEVRLPNGNCDLTVEANHVKCKPLDVGL